MKLLIYLIIAGKLLMVTPSVIVPEVDGVLSLFPSDSTLLLAHSNLAGTNFYDLKEGEKVTAIYDDSSFMVYEVSQKDSFSAKNSLEAISGNDFMMRVDDEWRMMLDVLTDYQSLNSITLLTCYAGNKGFDVVTGRLFIELIPIEDIRIGNKE
jgi:hypothetical protein